MLLDTERNCVTLDPSEFKAHVEDALLISNLLDAAADGNRVLVDLLLTQALADRRGPTTVECGTLIH